MLLKLPAFPKVPGPDGVVQATCPQFGAIVGYVYAAGAIRVSLELSEMQHLRLKYFI